MVPPTTVHQRINAREAVTVARTCHASMSTDLVDRIPLVLVSVLVEGQHLQEYAMLNMRREYDADRRHFTQAVAIGPWHQFMRRFSPTTRESAGAMQQRYWFL